MLREGTVLGLLCFLFIFLSHNQNFYYDMRQKWKILHYIKSNDTTLENVSWQTGLQQLNYFKVKKIKIKKIICNIKKFYFSNLINQFT